VLCGVAPDVAVGYSPHRITITPPESAKEGLITCENGARLAGDDCRTNQPASQKAGRLGPQQGLDKGAWPLVFLLLPSVALPFLLIVVVLLLQEPEPRVPRPQPLPRRELAVGQTSRPVRPPQRRQQHQLLKQPMEAQPRQDLLLLGEGLRGHEAGWRGGRGLWR
jgi:hypothetical protein